MSTPRDPDRMIRAFLHEGAEQLADPVYDAVRAEIETKRQRVVIGPWRMPALNKIVPVALGAAAVVAVLVVGAQFLWPADAGDVGASVPAVPSSPSASSSPPASSPEASPASGSTVTFQVDGAPATTVVDVAADGADVSGTAVTTFRNGTHTVQVECGARDGDFWAVAGPVAESTAESGSVGDWSAVIVRDGSPQAIAIWLSDPVTDGRDCAAWLGGLNVPEIGPENLRTVESGILVAPPGLPAATRSPGGSVTFQLDGAPATTVVDVVADGAAVSGKAVTTFQDGTHTVQVECAARDGDLWAVAGPVDTSTAEPGSVGDWSAVIVRESDPQAVAIWLSDPRTPGGDCAAWLGGLDLSGIGPENFHAVESGALVAPPDLAP